MSDAALAGTAEDAWRAPWQGRVDAADGAAGHRWHQIVRPWQPGLPAGVALLGLASDEGVRRNQGRAGAAEGPDALRRALAPLPAGEGLDLLDAGTVVCAEEQLEAAQADYAARAACLLQEGHLVIGLGGGHEIAWASYQALVADLRQRPSQRLAIVNFDAHFDLRADPRPTSGTPFLQALQHARQHHLPVDYRVLGISRTANTRALFDAASAWGVQWTVDEEMTLLHLDRLQRELAGWLRGYDAVYLSLCLDVLPASVAPGVSAPAARGVPQEVLEPLVQTVAGCGLLRLADVAELCPRLDADQRTARTAARLLWQVVESHRDAARKGRA
ncbi:MAG TPA: formimidoylglutamase [Burkholderiaceae bacterium]|nr:formimidoylglutamase [Burkholderiaceae bacterium]